MNFESIYTLSSLRARCRKALLTTRLANRWLTLTTRLYCNSLLLLALLLLNCSNRNLDKLQRVQNNLARVVCNSSRLTPAEPLLRSLHWLPVRQRIDYRLANLCYLAISFHQPVYLAHLIRPYSQSRSLRSSTQRIFTKKTNYFQMRKFSISSAILTENFI